MKYLIIITILITFGCSKKVNVYFTRTTEKQAMREYLIGSWYGKQPTHDDGTYEWVTTNYRDGKYLIKGIVTNSIGYKSYHQEVGEWGVSGNILFDIYKGQLNEEGCLKSDLTDFASYDVYKIISIKGNKIKYKAIPSGDKFYVTKENSENLSKFDSISSNSVDCFK